MKYPCNDRSYIGEAFKCMRTREVKLKAHTPITALAALPLHWGRLSVLLRHSCPLHCNCLPGRRSAQPLIRPTRRPLASIAHTIIITRTARNSYDFTGSPRQPPTRPQRSRDTTNDCQSTATLAVLSAQSAHSITAVTFPAFHGRSELVRSSPKATTGRSTPCEHIQVHASDHASRDRGRPTNGERLQRGR